MMQNKYKLFLKIAGGLNERFSLKPVLYGSLGLYLLVNVDRDVSDVDILVPEFLIDEKWNDLQEYMSEHGFKLINKSEHEFSNGEHDVAFASDDDLEKFAGVTVDELEIRNERGVQFRVLSLRQYLRVYKKMSEDGYRTEKKGLADQEKIDLIKQEMISG